MVTIMKERKTLTIAIPTYNGEKTIKDSLSILLPQCDDRVELIISDNASTDGTGEIVSEVISCYPEIVYVRNERNIGPDSNFIQCLKLAKGKYTLLLSDDDILLDNSLSIVLDFLENNDDLSVVYLNALGFREKYRGVKNCHRFKESIYDNKSFVTNDKREFMRYAGRMWGYLSCFIVLSEAYKSIGNIERFKKTNWVQSYVHVICSNYGGKKLGIISKPIIGAGIYTTIFNYDSGEVNGIRYRELIDFCISNGYEKKQMNSIYIWHVCFLSKRAIIKERAAGIRRTTIKKVLQSTVLYPYAWLHLYPYFFLPSIVCKIINYINNILKGYKNNAVINRQGDVEG